MLGIAGATIDGAMLAMGAGAMLAMGAALGFILAMGMAGRMLAIAGAWDGSLAFAKGLAGLHSAAIAAA